MLSSFLSTLVSWENWSLNTCSFLCPIELQLNQSKNNIPRARLKTLKMTVAFATSFTVCWTPYYVLGIWYWFDPEMLNRVSEPVNHFFFLFAFLNPCFDPLIYGYFSLWLIDYTRSHMKKGKVMNLSIWEY